MVGGISACYYLPAPRPNKDKGFVAGTVIVLRGTAKDVTRAAAMFEKGCSGGYKRACDLRKKLP